MYRTQEREKTQSAKPRETETGRKMKSDTGKKDFEIYMKTHSDWGILFYSDLSNTSFSKQTFIKNINNIAKKENENIGFSKHPYIGLLKHPYKNNQLIIYKKYKKKHKSA